MISPIRFSYSDPLWSVSLLIPVVSALQSSVSQNHNSFFFLAFDLTMFVIIVAIEIDFKLTYLWRIKDHLTEKSEARIYVYPLQVSEQQNQNNKRTVLFSTLICSLKSSHFLFISLRYLAGLWVYSLIIWIYLLAIGDFESFIYWFWVYLDILYVAAVTVSSVLNVFIS